MIHNKSVYKLHDPIGIFVNRFQDQIVLCYVTMFLRRTFKFPIVYFRDDDVAVPILIAS